jgi:hypothetical protein
MTREAVRTCCCAAQSIFRPTTDMLSIATGAAHLSCQRLAFGDDYTEVSEACTVWHEEMLFASCLVYTTALLQAQCTIGCLYSKLQTL